MKLLPTALNDLDPETVAQARSYIRQLLSEQNPQLNFSRGALADLIVEPAAILQAVCWQMAQRIRESFTLAQLEKGAASDPQLEEIIEALATNYLLKRHPATKACGTILIVLDNDISTSIPRGTIFTTAGKNFVTTATYTAFPEQTQVIRDTDRWLQPLGDQRWGFTIPVEAVQPGVASNIPYGSQFTTSLDIPNLIEVCATVNFSGGQDQQSITDLIDQFRCGIAAQTFTNAISLTRLLTTAGFPVSAISVIGAGDPEMRRDRHGLLPVSQGGKVDVYLQTTVSPQTITVPIKAQLDVKIGNIGLWRASVAANAVPGCYGFQAVFPAGRFPGAPCSVQEDIRGVDGSDWAYPPEIFDPSEGVYTAFQTIEVKFIDSNTDVSQLPLGTQRDYEAVILYFPYIREIQEFLSDPAHRDATADILVKAGIPCWVNASISLSRDDSTVSDEQIADTVLRVISQLSFQGQIFGSQVSAAIRSQLSSGVEVESLLLSGEIWTPQGTQITIEDAPSLSVPTLAEQMVSPRTVLFLTTTERIQINRPRS